MENELMNYEELNEVEAFETEERSGMSTGGAILLGAALTAAGIAVGKGIKKLIAVAKAKKEAQQAKHDFVVPDEDIEHESK
jgi:hypothetical protein